MVLETFAVTGGTPNASRVGNVISVPDPTTVFIVPAANPASPMAMASSGDTPRTLRGGQLAGGAAGGGDGGLSVLAGGTAGGVGSAAAFSASDKDALEPGLAALAASAIAAWTA